MIDPFAAETFAPGTLGQFEPAGLHLHYLCAHRHESCSVLSSAFREFGLPVGYRLALLRDSRALFLGLIHDTTETIAYAARDWDEHERGFEYAIFRTADLPVVGVSVVRVLPRPTVDALS